MSDNKDKNTADLTVSLPVVDWIDLPLSVVDWIELIENGRFDDKPVPEGYQGAGEYVKRVFDDDSLIVLSRLIETCGVKWFHAVTFDDVANIFGGYPKYYERESILLAKRVYRYLDENGGIKFPEGRKETDWLDIIYEREGNKDQFSWAVRRELVKVLVYKKSLDPKLYYKDDKKEKDVRTVIQKLLENPETPILAKDLEGLKRENGEKVSDDLRFNIDCYCLTMKTKAGNSIRPNYLYAEAKNTQDSKRGLTGFLGEKETEHDIAKQSWNNNQAQETLDKIKDHIEIGGLKRRIHPGIQDHTIISKGRNTMNTSDSAMTVKEAVGEVAGKQILVPEFLGKTDYRSGIDDVEKLFESILKGYPIGGFTFWNLEKPVPNIMFYEMIRHYTRSSDNSKPFEMGFRPFRAVLDGHNRLNSLYIGLTGTYACYTKPENEVDDQYPPRILYLNLWRPETPEPEQRGRFRFLTEKDYEKETQNGAVWVKTGRILDEDVPSILSSLSMPPEAGKEAEEILGRLADGICSRKTIRCCSIEGGPLDDVIGFLMERSSSGWHDNPDPKLFHLLAANWDEAKAEFEQLENLATDENSWWSHKSLDKKGILKICLALVGNGFKPSAEQFSGLIPKIKMEWCRIRPCICQVARLFRNIWGEYPCDLDSKPILAILYWFYKKGVSVRPKESKESNTEFETAVKKWMAFWNYAGTRDDSWFSGCQRVIDGAENEVFPFTALRELVMNGRARKRIENDLETIITSSWNDSGFGYPMSPTYLLPLLGFERAAGELKKSEAVHLHPKSFFKDREKLKEVFGDKPDDLLFAADPKNWDSVLNLCLVPIEKAEMKEQMSLKEWAEKTGTPNRRLYVDDDISLDIKDFRAFIENRRKKITALLRDLLL